MLVSTSSSLELRARAIKIQQGFRILFMSRLHSLEDTVCFLRRNTQQEIHAWLIRSINKIMCDESFVEGLML